MKKTILLLCASFCLFTTKAQVTIGSSSPPLAGALLDLKEFPQKAGGQTANKGLGLPRVKLTVLDNLLDVGVDVNTSTVNGEDYAGMVIYGMGDEEDIISGMYVWDGVKWSPLFRIKGEDLSGIEIITTAETVPLKQPNCYLVPIESNRKMVKIPIAKVFDVWDGDTWKKDVTEKVGYSPKLFFRSVLPTGKTISSSNLKAELVWKDVKDGLITKISLTGQTKNDTINVMLDNTPGNAVVALKDGDDILWSWHIWVTQPLNESSFAKNKNGMTWMDRNLGATALDPADPNINIMGLHYQFGRKDPFPASSSWSGDIEKTVYGPQGVPMQVADPGRMLANTATMEQNLINSIQYPFSFIYDNSSGKSEDWYCAEIPAYYNENLWKMRWSADYAGNEGEKSVTDPCPEGWVVPKKIVSSSAWNGLTKTGMETKKDGKGTLLYFTTPDWGHYVVAGYRDGSKGTTVGKLQHTGKRVSLICGIYRSSSKFVGGLNITLSESNGSPVIKGSTSEPRVRGNSIRCVKQE